MRILHGIGVDLLLAQPGHALLNAVVKFYSKIASTLVVKTEQSLADEVKLPELPESEMSKRKGSKQGKTKKQP